MTSNSQSADPALTRLLLANAQWARAVTEGDINFFPQSVKGQTPEFLWIGCADSRVPASVITGSKPGYIFTHRNIANQVHPEDDSVLSILAYGVDVLKIKRIIVVGHSECGGVAACVKAASGPSSSEAPATPLLRWLTPLIDLARSLNVGSLKSAEAFPLVMRENVKRQVQNVAGTQTIKDAWARGEDVQIQGLTYDLATGTLTEIDSVSGP